MSIMHFHFYEVRPLYISILCVHAAEQLLIKDYYFYPVVGKVAVIKLLRYVTSYFFK